jgi:hypothetical protein
VRRFQPGIIDTNDISNLDEDEIFDLTIPSIFEKYKTVKQAEDIIFKDFPIGSHADYLDLHLRKNKFTVSSEVWPRRTTRYYRHSYRKFPYIWIPVWIIVVKLTHKKVITDITIEKGRIDGNWRPAPLTTDIWRVERPNDG